MPASGSVTVDDTLTIKNISKNIEYIEDTKKGLTIDDIVDNKLLKWTGSTRNYINFGYTKSQYWFRFTVKNPTKNTIPWLLEIDFPPIDLIELYIPNGPGRFTVKKTGDTLPFKSKDVKDITYIFKIEQKPGIVTYFIRIDSLDSINFNLNMMSSDSYLERLHIDMAIYWIYFGFMIVMSIYSLCIFILMHGLDYLYFAFFVLAYSLFEFNFKGFASWVLWPNSTYWSNHANPFFVCLILIFVNMFLYEFAGFKNKFKKIPKPMISLLIILPLLLAILSLFINVQLSLKLTYILSLSILAVLIILGTYMAFFQKSPSRQARIAIIAFCIYSVTTPLAILTMIGLLPANFFTRWVTQLGSFVFIVLLSIGIADKINYMKNIIQKGEHKYRHLIESTSDIIFTLDDNNNILNINSAVKPHLGFRSEELVNTNFLELIQGSSEKNYIIARQLVLDRILELKNKKEGIVRFLLAMKVKYHFEPKEMKVNLEYTGYKDTEYAIIGKASPVTIDTHSELLESERYTYNINNYLNNAELLSQRLVRNLHKFTDASTISNIKIAVCETIINSIEHGNLNLTFLEKNKALAAGKYFDLIRERQMDSLYNTRTINIEYSLNKERVAYKISDEGDGFDYKWIFESGPLNTDGIAHAQERGLLIVKNTFDVVKFNQKGNQILLIKYFNNSGPEKQIQNSI